MNTLFPTDTMATLNQSMGWFQIVFRWILRNLFKQSFCALDSNSVFSLKIWIRIEQFPTVAMVMMNEAMRLPSF